MTKKLKILGPYTPEHEGPFCTRDGKPVRLLTKTDGSDTYPIIGFISNARVPACWTDRGHYVDLDTEDPLDLMNAREVPVAREFWVNSYPNGDALLFEHPEAARDDASRSDVIRTIHVREVLPGEGE